MSAPWVDVDCGSLSVANCRGMLRSVAASHTQRKPNLTPGENPKENTQDSEHGKSLKSRICPTVVM
jgi:hypothetical protein